MGTQQGYSARVATVPEEGGETPVSLLTCTPDLGDPQLILPPQPFPLTNLPAKAVLGRETLHSGPHYTPVSHGEESIKGCLSPEAGEEDMGPWGKSLFCLFQCDLGQGT